tara:strand:- start:27 stop:515 length:489 start_codon:yes stop_codon:yes gene_type:complete
MKKYILLLSLFVSFSCEDNDENESEGGQIVGLWKATDAGEYENANCTGDIDNMGFAFLQAFGITITMEFKSGGTGTYKMGGMGEDIEMPITWNESKSEFCLMGIECVEYKLNDNKFSFDQKADAYCEDLDGNEVNYDESTCEEDPSRTWNEASCSFNEFTKQ